MKKITKKIKNYIKNIFFKKKLEIKKKSIFKKNKFYKFGEFSTNIAFKISKIIKKNPNIISEIIIKNIINKNYIKNKIKYIKNENLGFINIKYSKFLKLKLLKILNKKFISKKIKKNIIVEFVSANPTGPLHLGHIKQAIIGETICNILKNKGYNIHKEFYCNNRGNQINKLIESIKNNKNFENKYKGKYIENLKNKVRNFNNKNEKILKNFCIKYFKNLQIRDLNLLKIKFNQYFSESKLNNLNIKNAIKNLKKKKLLYKKDKITWLKTKSINLKKNKVIKKNNIYTYLFLDIIYHLTKWNRGFSKSINIIGYDHIDIVNYVKKTIKKINPKIKNSFPKYIIHKMLKIKNKKGEKRLSKRKGNYITLKELKMELMKLKKIKNKKFINIEKKIYKIIKIFFIFQKNNQESTFKINNFIEKSNNTLYNINKKYFIIKSFFKKYKKIKKKHKIFIKKYTNSIILSLLQYKEIINKSYKKLEPSYLINYLIIIIDKLDILEKKKFFKKLNNINIKILLIKSLKLLFRNLLKIMNLL